MSYDLIMRRGEVEPSPSDAASWPAPSSEIVTAVRAALGRCRPPGSKVGRLAAYEPDPAVDRLDLIMGGCHMLTAAMVILWLNAERRQGRGTRTAYANDVIHWCEWLRQQNKPRLDLTALTRADIGLWLTHQRSLGRSKATIARRLAALSSLYRYAIGHGLPLVSPIHDDDHRPRIKPGRRATSARVLSADQITALFLACRDVRDAAIVALLFSDGLRVSELCSATVGEYEPVQRTIQVIRKGDSADSPTRIQVAPPVAALLDRWLAARPAWVGPGPAPLLYDTDGGRLTRDGVTRTLVRLARAAGIPHPRSVTPHSLRASAITDQIERGRSITDVQAFAGHADVRTTMTYFENAAADKRNAEMAADLARVAEALPPWITEEVREDGQHAA